MASTHDSVDLSKRYGMVLKQHGAVLSYCGSSGTCAFLCIHQRYCSSLDQRYQVTRSGLRGAYHILKPLQLPLPGPTNPGFSFTFTCMVPSHSTP